MPRASYAPRKDGRYMVRYKNKMFYGKTQTEAEKKREQYKRAEARGLREEAEGLRFQTYAYRWLEVYKANVTDRSYNNYELYVRKACSQLGQLRVKDITQTDIVKAYNFIVGSSGSMCRKYAMVINSIMEAAVADGLAYRNPCAKVKRPKGEEGSHRCLEDWEKDLVIRMAYSGHRMALAAVTMLYTGLRRGEVLALNIDEDVDFDNDVIHINKAIRYDSNQPILTTPKTEAGVRDIPLLPQLKAILQDHHGLVLPSTKGGYITETSCTELMVSYNTALTRMANDGISKRWYGNTREHKAILARGGELPPYKEVKVRFHDFRHTYCTMLYEANVDLKTAQRWMGHADEKMILQIYAHLSQKQELASLNKFTDYLLKDKVMQGKIVCLPRRREA